MYRPGSLVVVRARDMAAHMWFMSAMVMFFRGPGAYPYIQLIKSRSRAPLPDSLVQYPSSRCHQRI